MKNLFRSKQITALSLLLFVQLLFLSSFGPVALAEASAQCDHKTDQSFLNYLRKKSETVTSSKRSTNYSFLEQVAAQIEACEELPSSKDLKKCTTNFKRFAKVYSRRQHPNHKYGFSIPDSEYLSDPTTRAMTELPEEFRDGLPSDWKAIAERNKWPYAEFSSSIVGNKPFYSYRRMTVLVERPEVDLWIQFTLPDLDAKLPLLGFRLPEKFHKPFKERLINVIGIEKTKSPSARPRPYFAEYFSDFRGRNPRVHTRVSSCYECHANGMRVIVPAIGSVPASQVHNLKLLNSKMEKYGTVDWSGLVDVKGLGPAIGRKQTCVACHNDSNTLSGRAALRYYTNFSHIKFKMVDLLQMPIGLVNPSKAPHLSKALQSAHELTHEQQRETPLGIPFMKRYSSELDRVLSYLTRLGQTSPEDEKDAVAEKDQLMKSQKEQYDRLMQDYKADLKAWLLPDQHCGPAEGT